MGRAEWLKQRYYRWRKYVPARLLYHADYFRILQLSGAPPHVLDAVIDERLRHVLRAAVCHVPFYRRCMRLSAAELAHEPARELLARFPFIDKRTVMAQQRDFLDERVNPRWLIYTTSSGSTGEGIGMWRTKRLADIEKAFFAHAWSRLGFSFDKARYLRIGADAVRPGHEAPTRVWGNRLLLSPYHLADEHKAAIRAALNRFRPRFVHAYPSTVTALAHMLAPGELDFEVGAVLLASEPVKAGQLAAIEKLLRCPISISYGLTERTNLAFAEGSGGVCSAYRFNRLYAVNENRVNVHGAEIVGTSLWNDVMPLIRYRTGDYGTIGPDGACQAIDGREQDFLIDRDGRHIPGLTVIIDADTWDFVRTWQIWQSRPGAITIALVPRSGTLTPAQRQLVLARQRERWGEFFDISVQAVPEVLPAPGGKHRFVISSVATSRPASAATSRPQMH